MEAVRGIRQGIEAAGGGQPTVILVVWLDALMFDSRKAARKASRRMEEQTSVVHFWDPENLVGRLIAEKLGWTELDFAWDIYLRYGAGAEWIEGPPDPLEYVHQLVAPEASDSFQTGSELSDTFRGWLAAGVASKE